MASLINALDKQRHLGENKHVEYGWTSANASANASVSALKEQIVQLSFQLVRNANISSKFKDILQVLSCNINKDKTATVVVESVSEKTLAKEYLNIICKLIAQTRDIIDGKGEYTLSYMLVYELYQFFPRHAEQILTRFFHLSLVGDESVHPYGSWKDVKYFCKYVIDIKSNGNKQIGEFALNLMIEQLRKDELSEDQDQISLAAKWCPREKCARFGIFFSIMSAIYFKQYLTTSGQKSKAIVKCKMDFRKLLSKLNKKLDTIQIKQCADTWSKINHAKTTSITGMKQRKALLNIDNNGNPRTFAEDRVVCAQNYKEYLDLLKKSGKEVKGKRIGLNDFTVQALNLNSESSNESNQLEKDILNSQWRDNAAMTSDLGTFIPLVDVSGSMAGDPLHAAIALGIRIAEKSNLGKRVLTFSENGDWHDLSNCATFTDSVASLQRAAWGTTTNFYAAFNNILNAIIDGKLTSEQVEGMVLVILSDMQMNDAKPLRQMGNSDEEFTSNRNTDVLYEVMTKKYADAGMLLWNKPFSPPHILFWNLRQTSGFPVLTEQKNVTMISGFSPALLNQFCNKGIDALKNVNPWTQLVDSLDNIRFNPPFSIALEVA